MCTWQSPSKYCIFLSSLAFEVMNFAPVNLSMWKCIRRNKPHNSFFQLISTNFFFYNSKSWFIYLRAFLVCLFLLLAGLAFNVDGPVFALYNRKTFFFEWKYLSFDDERQIYGKIKKKTNKQHKAPTRVYTTLPGEWRAKQSEKKIENVSLIACIYERNYAKLHMLIRIQLWCLKINEARLVWK